MIDIGKYNIIPFGATPNERQIEHYKIGKKAFVHYGVNTYSGREWGDGNELEEMINPKELDTDQWIRVIKEAGFKLAIITAKHHDGFCLWPSKYTEHSIKNSPYKGGKGDIVKEFTDSCRKYGIKAGVYISPWDKNSPHWGKADYSEFFANQLTELLTEYGEIHEVWWDGAGSQEARYDWELWASIVRKYQPKAAIFGSMGASEYVDLRWVGNENGFAGETHYASIDPKYIFDETPVVLNVGQIGGRKYIPSETDVSIRPGWFYHESQDDYVKTPSMINKIWFESVGRNSMMLLNFPPDKRGLICDKDAKNARLSHQCISKMLSRNFVDDAKLINRNLIKKPIVVKDSVDGKEFIVHQGLTFDFELKNHETLNVFTVSELVEAGERVTEFTLERVDDNGKTELLYTGTSIGFYRAVQFKKGLYKRLRFTVKGALAEPLLTNFGLHYFEDIAPSKVKNKKNSADNIVKRVEFSDKGKIAVASFEGIFPFNYLEFKTAKGSAYKVFSFNGLNYDKITDGVADEELVKIHVLDVNYGSYQIKIECENAITDILCQ